MATKDTSYYMDRGRDHAAKLDLDSYPLFPQESTSWQARAYWSGYHGRLMPAKQTERELTSDEQKIADQCKQAGDLVTSGMVFPGTKTGRISSHAPEPHPLPPRTKEGKAVIEAFRPVGGVFTDSPTTPPTPAEKTPPARSWQASEAELTISRLPDGPRSHFQDLCRQLETEEDPKRQDRLARAAQRVWDKWAVPA